MDIDYKHISLEQLKNDISSLEGQQLSDYFDDKLSMAAYRDQNGYSIIIKFFNHLKDEYNQCVNKNNGQETNYHSILFKTFNWFLPLLHPYHKIIVHSNICILADDEQDTEFHKEHFKNSLKNINRLIEATGKQVSNDEDKSEYEREILCQALASIGYLNIREHNYEYAILCFRICLELLSKLNIETPNLYDIYINSIVRLTNCYEYTDRPWCAINCILQIGDLLSDEDADQAQHQQTEWKTAVEKNAGKIKSKIIAYYSLPERKLKSKDDTINIVTDIYSLLSENSREHILKWAIISESSFDTLNSYIHVLAHCISEYASKIRVDSYSHPFCSTLQLVSRFLLDWLVESCHDESLVTCQATVRAENDACPEALKLLLQRHAVLEKRQKGGSSTTKEQNELQEIEFFLFYFAEQELRYNYTDHNLESVFNKYGDKFFESASSKAKDGDYDSLFHFYVIKFKYLLKQKIDEFMHIPANKKLDMKEVDNVFLEMCRCKELCSEQIFKGLLDECKRLEELFLLFQQLQWLNSKDISKSKFNLFKQLWLLHTKSKESFNIKNVVRELHDDIIKRNKILILAPIKNAPSCSSEYENIHQLLDLPMTLSGIPTVNGSEFTSSIYRIKRERSQTIQYSLNKSDKYSKLKWAVFCPNEAPFSYIYLQNNTTIEPQDSIEYSGIIPVYLDKEYDALRSMLQKIDNDISEEYDSLVINNNICPQQRCGYDSQCNTLILEPGCENNLRTLIYELLVFLEFDFYAARKIGNLDKEYLLINYPKNGFLGVLAFDDQLPVVDDEKGLCDICNKCLIELRQDSLGRKDEKKCESVDSCETFSIDALKDLRDKVHKKIDYLEVFTSADKSLIKSGSKSSRETEQSEELTHLCFLLNQCIDGICSKTGKQRCETCKLLKENGYIE